MTTPPTGGASESALERIRRLLALAADENTSEHERDTATTRALTLMAKHSVDQAMVDAHTSARTDPMQARRVTLAKPYPTQRVELLDSIATPLNCRVMWSQRRGHQPHQATIFGRRSDIDRVEWLWTSLTLQLTQGMTADHPEQQGSWWQHVYDRGERTSLTMAYRRSWMSGFSQRVGTRLWNARRAGIEDTGGAQLVLRDRSQAATEAMNTAHPQLTATDLSRATDSRGYLDGTDAAETADLGQTRVGQNRRLGR